MAVESLERILREHAFFAGLDDGFCKLVCGCAKNTRFAAGEHLCREGEPADTLFLIRHGRVGLEVHRPGGPEITFLTLGAGEVVGVSWLIPPYRWAYDAKALELVRAIAIDAKCLREKCEADHHLGYEMMKRVMSVLVQRLHTSRLQILDVYGDPR